MKVFSRTYLYRPVGPDELRLIAESDYKRFPPRLPEQPIFYPVCNKKYADKISKNWNAPHYGYGYTVRFEISTEFIEHYERQIVGSREHEEYWIPAEELETFNDAIIGKIEVIEVFHASYLRPSTN